MAFKEGNNLGKGRPKGSQNKKTLAKKERLEQLFNENGGFEALFVSINQIEEPKDKAAVLLKVMEFFMAKHKAIEHTGVEPAKHRTPEEIQQDLKELNGE